VQVEGKAVGEKAEGKGKTRFSKTNTAKKFLADQVLGAPVNTALFLLIMGWFSGLQGEALVNYVRYVSCVVPVWWLVVWDGADGVNRVFGRSWWRAGNCGQLSR